MGKQEVVTGIPAMKPQGGLEPYEPPAVSELGTVEDLTWTSSFDLSTGV
jgi:hypothetical protein